MKNDVLGGYAAASPTLIARFEAISCIQLYEPVIDLFPASPAQIANIGAGTGRDAAWLAGKGHRVLAVEPVEELRQAGMAFHASMGIEWLDDRLPDLTGLEGRARFDVLLLSGVWQHLDDRRRCRAMPNLARLTAPGGLAILSLRHGPGAPDRPVHPVVPEDTIEAASSEGFTLLRRRETVSIQPANRAGGVRWTWLVFRRS